MTRRNSRGPSCERASSDIIATRYEDGLAGFNRALEVERACGIANERDALVFRGRVTGWRGITRAIQGDRSGVDEVEEAIVDLTAAGEGRTAMVLKINLTISIVLGNYARPSEVQAHLEDAVEFGRARGLRADLAWLEMEIIQNRYDLGEHDRMFGDFTDLDRRLGEQGASAVHLDLRASMLRVDILRGHDPGAERLEWIEQTARHTEAAESLSAGLGTVGAARLMVGDPSAARRLLAELVAFEDVGTSSWSRCCRRSFAARSRWMRSISPLRSIARSSRKSRSRSTQR